MIPSQTEIDQIAERAHSLYEQRIRALVEPAHNGKFLILNVDTGEYAMDEDDVIASDNASERFPDAPLFAFRVGFPAAYRLGGAFRPARP